MTRAGIVVPLLLATGAIFLSGCGGKDSTRNRVDGSKLTIYASVPLNGPSAVSGRAVINGASIALSEVRGRIGKYRIVLRPLDDATATTREWDPGQTTVNARIAIRDPSTIGYLGEFNSGASAVSIPILNRLEIPQISSGSTAVGLTSAGPGASPGEPAKYYPTGIRTFARVIPSDLVQAEVQVKIQRAAGCRNGYVVDDGEFDGEEMATSFELAAHAARFPLVGVQTFPPHAPDYRAFAAGVASSKPDCVLVSAITDSDAVAVIRQLAAALPAAPIFATNGLAESTFVDPDQGGLPASLDSRLLVTSATLGPGAQPPSALAFDLRYRRRYGPSEPAAIFGYEAMSVLLRSIATATDDGRHPALRSRVLAAMFATDRPHSAIGPYSIRRDGDTTIDRYGVYRILDGHLQFWKAVHG